MSPMPVPAGADAERDEADAEDEREEHEHPLRVPAQAREEHGVLDHASAAAAWQAAEHSAALRARVDSRAISSLLSGSARLPSTRVATMRSGEPPRTAAPNRSSHGRKGSRRARGRSSRRACPAPAIRSSSSSPSCAPPSVRELERVGREQGVRSPLARACRHDGRAQLVEHVERRRGRRAVGRDATGARLTERRQRRDPAAEEPFERGSARRRRRAPPGRRSSARRRGRSARRGRRAEHTGLGERGDGRTSERRTRYSASDSQGPAPVRRYSSSASLSERCVAREGRAAHAL